MAVELRELSRYFIRSGFGASGRLYDAHTPVLEKAGDIPHSLEGLTRPDPTDQLPGKYDRDKRTLWVNGKVVKLRPQENVLFSDLYDNPNHFFTARQLLYRNWPPGSTLKTFRTTLSRLRGKIEEDPRNPKLLITDPQKHGFGLRRYIDKRRTQNEAPLKEKIQQGKVSLTEATQAIEEELISNGYDQGAAAIADVKRLLTRAHLFPVYGENGRDQMEIYRSFLLVPERHAVMIKGEEIDLTPREYDTLEYLVSFEDRFVPAEELLDHYFPFDGYADLVRAAIHGLRNKIEEDPRKPKIIISRRLKGYRFINPNNPYVVFDTRDTVEALAPGSRA